MNFGIDVISLWSHAGDRRDIKFARNCVNVITGDSQTGKTALLGIIDYCFLAGDHNLPHSVINENTAWYGLKLYVNDKEMVIARRSPHESRVSSDYYFSSVGTLPDAPEPNAAEDDIRNILEAEFGIDERTVVQYGGRALRMGSKVSFRFLFLFNTISDEIILSTKTFFDKQADERYREALPRIFDLALGIDDVENIAAREKKEQLRKELAREERKAETMTARRGTFDREARAIAAKAAEFGLIDEEIKDITPEHLRDVIREASSPAIPKGFDKYSDLNAQVYAVDRRLRRLQQFTKEYKAYKDTLGKTDDSLRPLAVILARSPELVKSEVFDELISGLKVDLERVKDAIAPRRPVDGEITSMVKRLENEKAELKKQLEALPQKPQSFESVRDLYLFLGEARGKLTTYIEAEPTEIANVASSESDLQSQFDAIQVRDVEEARDAVIDLIEEVAVELIGEVSASLENYANWQAVFNYREKRLQLRKPKSTLIENVGSSSNHMFLHLIQFLALHEVAINKKSKLVPSFLVLDQPSRPYYGEKDKGEARDKHGDDAKISAAFGLLDSFIERMNSDYQSQFQMIVFEHVPTSLLEGMPRVHLVEEFRNGNALIPHRWIS
ncbi:DUF3732 domain-containing protein [Paraburkholderia xenovorans]|uniref:DUF3732 domain-containing protein n=1 Tax=Paraburkholderia xenovorans TaxID=36873 RepID=UPI0038BDD83B